MINISFKEEVRQYVYLLDYQSDPFFINPVKLNYFANQWKNGLVSMVPEDME